MDTKKELYASVILPLPLHDQFTYRVPEDLAGKVKPGVRVIVQFGAKKSYSALVAEFPAITPEGITCKDITAVLDETEIIHPVNLRLWHWISDYYMSPFGEVMNAALPSALKLESSAVVSFQTLEEGAGQTAAESAILEQVSKKDLTISDLSRILGSNFSLTALRKLISENRVQITETIEEKYRPKTSIWLSLNPDYLTDEAWNIMIQKLSRAPKQKEIMIQFAHHPGARDKDHPASVPREKLLEENRQAGDAIRQLVDKGILMIRRETVSRIDREPAGQTGMNLLNPDQQEALENIRAHFRSKQAVLLHGVTASGKTEIYIQMAGEVCRQGRQVLYLIPEIALTPQIENRLTNVFGRRIGVYHSRMSDAERAEVWNSVLAFDPSANDSIQVILGARSAIFLPFSNLGLIIVDEEHENTYKQSDPGPRYHARDMAIVLGQQHQAPVLLGSATPSFESYFNALTGKYGLTKLMKRHASAKMPVIETSDLQEAYKRRQMKSILTSDLHGKIEKALSAHEQVVLFQNRRGYSPYMECTGCGWIPRCVNCDVSLTYHRKQNRLACHYCGHHTRVPLQCPKCNSDQIRTRGLGTEKIEEEITGLFPAAKTARMDLDTTRAKHAFRQLIQKLENRKVDILVGTQMVTKGLDVEHISLVGILNADNLLNFPDFRAHERAFQLMHQVSGRSGRKNKEGQVIIQTSQPQHPVIRFLMNNDYEGFFHENMAERKVFRYPPWVRMIKIQLKHKNRDLIDDAASALAERLRKCGHFMVLGPEYPLISRVQQLFAKQIWLKMARDRNTREAKTAISQSIEEIKQNPLYRSVQFQLDVDPA